MAKYIPDILSKRWVIVSPTRSKRPDDHREKTPRYAQGKHICPLCPGNEKLTPPEVFRISAGEQDESGWKVRVVPNKYPITDFHEVIVHSPSCRDDLEDLPPAQVDLIFKTYRNRYNFHKSKGQVLIFCNRGEHAGASLSHPHSQLVVIPSQINLDALSREPLNNLVDNNKYFNVYCPDFSQWPYEVWIAPKKEGAVFGDITDEEIVDIARLLQKILKRLHKIYQENPLSKLPFGYNLYIYPKENWYLRIIPRLIHRAGFELGTGLSVNVVDPLEASLTYKGIETKMVSVLSKLKKY
jgi:UDPglucose--hexose-1-phosphate uridylyltransferase